MSHYRIVSKIGAGIMSEVYLAKDMKLDRQIALKILPPEFAEDAETNESAGMMSKKDLICRRFTFNKIER